MEVLSDSLMKLVSIELFAEHFACCILGLGNIEIKFCDYCLKVTCDYYNIATTH